MTESAGAAREEAVREQGRAREARRELALFFGLTYLISWVCWEAAALSGQDVTQWPWLIAHTVGGFAPSLVGVALVYRSARTSERRAATFGGGRSIRA